MSSQKSRMADLSKTEDLVVQEPAHGPLPANAVAPPQANPGVQLDQAPEALDRSTGAIVHASGQVILDENMVIEYIRDKNWSGLDKYLTLIVSIPHNGVVQPHLGLLLTIHELKLVTLVEEDADIQSATVMFNNIFTLMSEINISDNCFTPLDLQKRLDKMESYLRDRKFPEGWKAARITALLDYIRLYFPSAVRPQVDVSGNYLLQFVMAYKDENNLERYRCLACGWVVPERETLNFIWHHLKHSVEVHHHNHCEALTMCLVKRMNYCEKNDADVPDFNTFSACYKKSTINIPQDEGSYSASCTNESYSKKRKCGGISNSYETDADSHFSWNEARAEKRQAEGCKMTSPVDVTVELFKISFHMMNQAQLIGVSWLADAMLDICRSQHKLITNVLYDKDNLNHLNKVMDFVESLQVFSRRFMTLFDTLTAEEYGSVSVCLSTLYEVEDLVYMMRCICLKKKALGWGAYF